MRSEMYVIEELVTGAPPVPVLSISDEWTEPNFTLSWTIQIGLKESLLGAIVEINDGVIL